MNQLAPPDHMQDASAMTTEQLLFALRDSNVRLSVKDAQLLCQMPKEGIAPELKAQLIQRKDEVRLFLMQAQASKARLRPPVLPRQHAAQVPVSFPQQRLWLLDQLQGHSTQYNMPFALEVQGQFAPQVAKAALNELCNRHHILRTTYVLSDGQACQQHMPTATMEFTIKDFAQTTTDPEQRWQEVIACAQADAARPFDLARDVMLRASWLPLSAERGILLFNMHHIASDGWSFRILIREFCQIYQALSAGQTPALAPLPVQYADYACWQRDYLQGAVYQHLLDYWRQQLADIPLTHDLPLDFPRSQKKATAGAVLQMTLPNTINQQLPQFCQKQQLTPFMLMHAVLNVVLSRYGSNNIAIGTAVANRVRPEVEGLIGFFVNTLVLFTKVNPLHSVSDLLAQVKQVNEGAQQHQDFPFEKLVEELNLPRDNQHPPLFQIMLSMDNISETALAIEGLRFSQFDTGMVHAKFDIELAVRFSGDELILSWIYDDSLLKAETIQALHQSYVQVLSHLVQATPEMLAEQVGNLPVLAPQQIKQLCVDFNQTSCPFSEQVLIHELFQATVARQPDALALICGEEHLSYAQLAQQVNRMAHWLRAQGVVPDTVVGVYMERSVAMVVALMAVVSAGGAYLPLDPSLPGGRIKSVLEEANLSLVLTQQHLHARLADALKAEPALPQTLRLVTVDDSDFAQQAQQYADSAPQRLPEQNSRHLAYVIFTSGSTGKPKGVMVEHQALMNRIEWMDKCYPLTPQDRVLQKTPFAFDVSVWEFFWTLGFGACIVVAKPEGHKDPLYISELVEQKQVTVLHFVPSMLNAFLSSPGAHLGPAVKVVFCSGEALKRSDVITLQQRSPSLHIFNLYGPTEAAIDVSVFDCADVAQYSQVPIGKPIQNLNLFVLDLDGFLRPAGSEGELYIGGTGLARGYLNNSALTLERFREITLADGNTHRLYKTGDWVRLLPDGNIEYLQRIDKQVKLRGFRVELGDIEQHLHTVPELDSAVALVLSIEGTDLLVAYVKPRQVITTDLGKEQLRLRIQRHLQALLPAYMIPEVIEVLEQWPVTSNGKVDIKSLPPVTALQENRRGAEPRTETERRLCQLWAKQLRCESVGADVSFFQAGGTSIMLIQLVQLMSQQFGLQLTVVQMFQHTTVQAMARYIDSQTASQAQVHAPEKTKRDNVLANRRKNTLSRQ